MYDGTRLVRRAFVAEGDVTVHPDDQGGGIGRALQEREIRTWNDTLNAPMPAINTALGLVRRPTWITDERTR